MSEIIYNEQFLKISAVFFIAIGLCWGSFLNVCIYRIPIGKSIVYPPSACPSCGRMIKWYENIPVLSWLLLRGKCAGCKGKISIVYPAVEMLTGLLFLFSFMTAGYSIDLPFYLYFVSAMIVISGVDITHQIIPPSISIPGIGFGLLYGWLSPNTLFLDSLFGMLLGGGVLLLVIGVFYLVTKKIGMGGGDVALLAMIGAFLGPMKLPAVLFAASISGILFFFAMKLFFKKKIIAENISKEDLNSQNDSDLGHVIYFGPFLAFSGVCFLFIDAGLIYGFMI